MKKINSVFKIFLLIVIILLGIQGDVYAHPSRLVDHADLLDDYDEQYLDIYLNKVSKELEFDIVVVTTLSTEGKSSRDYADDFFDYNGYGMGTGYDGALLLVDMGQREWYISTSGYGIEALSDGELDYIGEEVAEYLSYGEYASAFETFADLVSEEVRYQKDKETVTAGEILLRFLISLAAGAGLAFVPVTIMKKQLDNVNAKNEASDYVKRDQIVITEQRDIFLYRNLHRSAKPKDTGGSSHRGSSGRSHGGRGGGF